MILVIFGQPGGVCGRDRLADHADNSCAAFRHTAHHLLRRAGADELQVVAVGVKQPLFDERDSELGDIDADPLATEFLQGVNRCTAAAEWVEHHVAGIAAGLVEECPAIHALLLSFMAFNRSVAHVSATCGKSKPQVIEHRLHAAFLANDDS